MALDLITGHQGVAHISAEQISDINKAMMNGYGDNKVMRMSGGAITQNALALEIATGYWRANGFDIQIQESETHYIDPSTIGTSRIDNIYVELLQNIPTGAQRAEITIIMGEEAASPVAPDDPTEPYLNTDILLDAVQIGAVTVTEGAMVFTDMTEAYDLVTPSDLAAVQTLATNALGMIQDDSDAYSSSKSYAVGDLCIHDNVVYKCITACSAAAWSVNQNCFEETTLTNELSTLKDALNEMTLLSNIPAGADNDTEYTLSDSITNYKTIMIVYKTNWERSIRYYPVEYLSTLVGTSFYLIETAFIDNTTGSAATLPFDYNASCTVNFISTTKFKSKLCFNNPNWNLSVTAIYGINHV